MFDLAVSASNSIESVVFIWWVWLPSAILIWLVTVVWAIRQAVSYRQVESGILGSILGAILGFMFAPALTLLPFFVPFILAGMLIITLGAVLAYFIGDKQ